MVQKIEIVIDVIKKQENGTSVRKRAYMTPAQMKNPAKVFNEICVNKGLVTSSVHDARLSHIIMFKTAEPEEKMFYTGFARKMDAVIGPKMNLERMTGATKIKKVIDYNKDQYDQQASLY